MPELDDDVEAIKEGSYVYWMHQGGRQDDDIPRGTLGEVLDVDEKVRVEFPSGKVKIPAEELNVSDFQKGTYVHSTEDGLSDEVMGQVKGLDDGKLKVEFEGEIKIEKPKYLMKANFQADSFVFWKKADDDIPAGHVGKVKDDVTEKGKVRVSFPNGTWSFRARDLVKCQVQPGSYVQWTESDDDVAVGEIGEVTGEVSDSGKVKVAFSKGTWSFKSDQLILFELQLGAFVKWENIDEDVPKGDIGQVVGIKVSSNRLRVQFPKGRWKFKANELSSCRIQPGDLVVWCQEDEDIPRGDIGEVIRLNGRRLSIQWPKGHWSMRMTEVDKFKFQKGDRVQWTKSDDDVPEGCVGVVLGVRYAEDSGKRLYVNWPNGRWSFKPHTLVALNFDVEGANQLKLSFKRFDANGDGKLSEEEFVNVLSKLGEGGGLAPEECKQLFQALDKDGNGRLTVNEFIDYVFSDASKAAKMVLADGFGLNEFVGLPERKDYDDDFNDDEILDAGMKGQPMDRPPELKSSYSPEATEGIDADTEISKAEWATAMLTVGVPRAAAVTSFEAVQEEKFGKEILRLKDLAAELNGMGGPAGVEELRGAVGKVKHGEVDTIDLDTPSEEVEAERDLARKSGLDGLVFYICYHGKSREDAVKLLPDAKLSALEQKVLGEMSEEDLLKAVTDCWKRAPNLSAVASWQRARENCQREVQEIIDRCKEEGCRFRDKSFDPVEDQANVLYVDKKKPGWDCTVSMPYGWKQPSECRGVDKPCLTKNDAEFSDVKQGQIGDCFFVAALAAMAARRKSFLRQAIVAYDMDVGVYGVMLLEEMHFTYEIVDELLGVDDYDRVFYGKSATDKEEFWVSIVEKAFFKHMTCLENCDGGWGTEVVFSFMGGVWGKYDVEPKLVFDPKRFWEILDQASRNGEIMHATFIQPSKGRYSNGEGEDGQCGEHGMGCGLVENHAYSVLGNAVVDGHRLSSFRNPWAKRETRSCQVPRLRWLDHPHIDKNML
eukprot:s1035_g12.t1